MYNSDDYFNNWCFLTLTLHIKCNNVHLNIFINSFHTFTSRLRSWYHAAWICMYTDKPSIIILLKTKLTVFVSQTYFWNITCLTCPYTRKRIWNVTQKSKILEYIVSIIKKSHINVTISGGWMVPAIFKLLYIPPWNKELCIKKNN